MSLTSQLLLFCS